MVDDEVRAVGADRTRLLGVVERVQQRFGYLSNDAVDAIASGLGIHAVEVEDMVSFYSFLDRGKRGRLHIRLSKTPIFFMKGAQAVAEAFEQSLGLSFGETSPDGMFMRVHPLGRDAMLIGEVTDDDLCFVQVTTSFGGGRSVDWLAGEQLPRIC